MIAGHKEFGEILQCFQKFSFKFITCLKLLSLNTYLTYIPSPHGFQPFGVALYGGVTENSCASFHV